MNIKDTAMKKAMTMVINNHENGLLVLPMPTGSGKSFNAIEIFYEALHDVDSKTYVYITPALKNKVYDDLKARCSGNEEDACLFESLVIDVQKNSDMMSAFFARGDSEKIISHKELKKPYEALSRAIQKNQVLKNTDRILDNSEEIDACERQFRKAIHKLLKSIPDIKNKSNKAVIEYIRGREDLSWILDMYPGALIHEKRIIIMSVAKMMFPFDPIIETPYYIYESKHFKNAVFVVDEFDAAKKEMQKQIINRDLRTALKDAELVTLFHDIRTALMRKTNDFPEDLFIPSVAELAKGYTKENLMELIDKARERAEELNDEMNLQFEIKSKDLKEGEAASMIFHDNIRTMQLGNNASSPIINTSQSKRINYIESGNNRNQLKLTTFINRLDRFIRWFIRVCYVLTINYHEHKVDQGFHFYEQSDAVSTILSSLHIHGNGADFISEQVLYGTFARRVVDRDKLGDGYLENGFTLFTVEDDDSHDMNSIVKMEDHSDTPEKIMLKMCNHGLVFGLSATADIETCIGNFDLPYIRSKIDDKYIQLDEETLDAITDEYESLYGKHNKIHVFKAKEYSSDNELECWNYIYEEKDESLADEVLGLLMERYPGKSGNSFSKRQHIFHLMFAFDYFLAYKDIRSFLCLMNTYMEGDWDFIYKLMNSLIDIYASEDDYSEYKNLKAEDMVCILRSFDYSNAKQNLLDELKSGNKKFVVSVYQALATGQNLQYETPEELLASGAVKRINDRRNDNNEKDFDACFLEKPSHIIVNLSDIHNMLYEDKIKGMHQFEQLNAAGEISRTQTNGVLNYLEGGGRINSNDYYGTESVKSAAAALVIQGVGRIGRTNIKNNDTYILYDGEIVDCFTQKILNSKSLRSPEVKSLMKNIRYYKKQENDQENELRVLAGKAEAKSDNITSNINRFLYDSPWTEDKIQQWEDTRYNLLADPQALTINRKSPLFIDLPERATKYYYRQSYDFKNNNISFNKELEGGSTVSSESTRLDIVISIPELKEFMERKGYAVTFEPSDRMMAPVVANNLYKGVLGEEIGKYLFEKYIGYKLERFVDPEYYENFDYHINDYTVVVDFKNWSEHTRFDHEEYKEKLLRKAQKCGAKLVLVINLFASENYKPFETTEDGIHVVEIPHLIVPDDNGYRIDTNVFDGIKEILRGVLNG